MHRRPEKTSMDKVAQEEGEIGTASTAKARAACALLHHQPMHGCIGSVAGVSRRRRTRKPYFRDEGAERRAF
jgi:hypothetical protein